RSFDFDCDDFAPDEATVRSHRFERDDLLLRLEVRFRRRPELKCTVGQQFAPGFQLFQAPALLGLDIAIQLIGRLLKPVLHRELFPEGAVRILRVIARDRKVGEAVNPERVNLLIIRAEILTPLLGESLRHDVLDCEVIRRDATSDVANVLRGALLQYVEEVAPVLVHRIEVPGLETFPEFTIAWESPATLAVEQEVRQDLAIWLLVFTQLLNVPVGASEDLVQRISTKVGDHSPEDIAFDDSHDGLKVTRIDHAVFVVTVCQPQQRLGYPAENEVGTTQPTIDFLISCGYSRELPRIHGEVVQLFSELPRTLATLLREVFEGLVHIRPVRGLRGLGDEEPADKFVRGIVHVLFHLVPVLFVDLVLLALREVHEDEVSDLVRFLQSQAGGVERLEDALRVVLLFQVEKHDLEVGDPVIP